MASPSLDPIPSDHLILFQAVITHYYLLLIADWMRTHNSSEKVPKKHRAPPCIDNWDRKQVSTVLDNFFNFTRTRRYVQTRKFRAYAMRNDSVIVTYAKEVLGWSVESRQSAEYRTDVLLRALLREEGLQV